MPEDAKEKRTNHHTNTLRKNKYDVNETKTSNPTEAK
jgi:hypothetical protein